MSIYAEFDPCGLPLRPLKELTHKVRAEQFACTPAVGSTFAKFFASLPDILAGRDIRIVAERIAAARRLNRAVVAACGGHVIKCGLAPVLIALMEAGLITAIAVNGAVPIHDIEIALVGSTSEDVAAGLATGTFGTARDTADFYHAAMARACREKLGAGEAIGLALCESHPPGEQYSLLAAAYRLKVPVTVHIALGTDTVHMGPCADGALIGEASLRDFRILTAALRDVADGGVVLNIGSAVVLPEVMLKAIAALRSTDPAWGRFLGVNMDAIQHYRSNQQVVNRVRAIGGEGIALTGHHEIMLPLLAHAALEACRPDGQES